MNDRKQRPAPATVGFTLQIYVPRSEALTARSYYARLFGREPDFEPHDDFFEWSPISGQECWFQVSGHDSALPLNNRVRFRVIDLRQSMEFLDSCGIAYSQPSQLPGVVAFVDFADPWGNRLGYYEDLVPSGQQRQYRGSSVSDAALFDDFSDD